MNDKILKVQEDIDLILAQQTGEMKYFRKVKPETSEKMTELCVKEVELDNKDRASRE